MKNIAVVLAGGSGRRFGAEKPKQFLVVAGRTILEHTLSKFDKHPDITGICLVVHPDYMSEASLIIENAGFSKPVALLAGGKERYDSSLAAIRHYNSVYASGVDINLLFHDAVRPMISADIITNLVRELDYCSAVCVAVPATDTLYCIDAGRNIMDIPDRARIWNAQTPQGFRLELITQAYEKAISDPAFATTDDCGVVFRYMPEQSIKIVEGDPCNIKLTYKTDMDRLEVLLEDM